MSAIIRYTMRYRYNAVNYLETPHNTHPIAGASFVNSNFHLGNIWDTTKLYRLSCNIGARYSGTLVYSGKWGLFLLLFVDVPIVSVAIFVKYHITTHWGVGTGLELNRIQPNRFCPPMACYWVFVVVEKYVCYNMFTKTYHENKQC